MSLDSRQWETGDLEDLHELMECPVPTDLSGCVAILANVISKGVERELAPFGIQPAEFALMRVCLIGGETTATELGRALPVDASRISRIVNRLVETGLLRRRRLREDRRVVRLGLTPEGRQLIEELVRRVAAFEAATLAGIHAEELHSLIAATCKIRVNFMAREKALGAQNSEPLPESGFPGYLEDNL